MNWNWRNTDLLSDDKLEDKHFDKRNKTLDKDCGILTGCEPKVFKDVVSRISNDKIFEINDLGFGPVHQFRCRELNLSLCKMLLDNFNVKNCTIKIHGRNLSIMEKDFDGLMGLRCCGIEVTIPKSLSLDAELAELQGQIWGVDKEMTIDRLRNNVVFTDNPDELFMVSFVLFVLAIMFCPNIPGYVDSRMLSLVKERKHIRSYNWGRFAFKKLFEVKLYQTKKTDHVGGCLVFLQLFYLSVVGERMFIIPKSVPSVMTWGSNESNMIYKRVAEKGGFNASEGIWVTRRYSGVRSTEFSGSRDYNTGLKTNLVDDMFAMRSHISVAEEKVGVLETTVHRMGPDILNLRDAMTALYDSVVKLKARDVTCIVDDVLRAVESIECGHSGPMGDDVNTHMLKPVCANTTSDAKGSRKSLNRSVEVKKQGQHRFGGVANLSLVDMDMLKYLFNKKTPTEDCLGSAEVGRFREFSVSRWDLLCLSPSRCISNEVINIMGEYYFTNMDDWWFWSTLFSIFIPINDDVLDHWFLVVANIIEDECEIWDNIPDLPAQQRRKNLVNGAMSLLGEIFSSHLRELDLPPSAFSSYSFTYPDTARDVPNKCDSGIFTIRHMKYYRERWFSNFNSDDEPVRIAFEIVNNPMNECYKKVWDCVYREEDEWRTFEEPPTTEGVCGGDQEPFRATTPMKFKPHVPRR
ncbi:hypothetical protein ACLB2K_002818 [Fragaria x ananassa]